MAATEFSPRYWPENATIAFVIQNRATGQMESSDHILVKHWKAAIPRERNLGRIYEKPMADCLCARIGGMGTGTIIQHSLFWFGKNRNLLGAGCKSGFRIKTPRSFSGRRADLIQSRPGVRAVLSVERRRCPLWRGTFQGARSQRSSGELGKGKISNISGMG